MSASLITHVVVSNIFIGPGLRVCFLSVLFHTVFPTVEIETLGKPSLMSTLDISNHWYKLSAHHTWNCRIWTHYLWDGNEVLLPFSCQTFSNYEERANGSLVQIWKVKFGNKVKFLFRLWGQGFKVCSRFQVDVQARFWSWSLVIILLLMIGWGYKVLSRFRS